MSFIDETKPFNELDFDKVDFDDPNWSWHYGLDDNHGYIAYCSDEGYLTAYQIPKCIIDIVNFHKSRAISFTGGKMKMKRIGYHGTVYVDSNVFDKLDSRYFISHCTDTVKYMCANDNETEHLSSLGIKCIACDWYKIVLLT